MNYPDALLRKLARDKDGTAFYRRIDGAPLSEWAINPQSATMNFVDFIGLGLSVLLGIVFSSAGVALLFLRFKDRNCEIYSGEVIGNEWQQNGAETGASFHPEIRVTTDSGSHNFVDDCGQIPARRVGQEVRVIWDEKTERFRILRSWGLSLVFGLMMIGVGVGTPVFVIKSSQKLDKSEEHSPGKSQPNRIPGN